MSAEALGVGDVRDANTGTVVGHVVSERATDGRVIAYVTLSREPS